MDFILIYALQQKCDDTTTIHRKTVPTSIHALHEECGPLRPKRIRIHLPVKRPLQNAEDEINHIEIIHVLTHNIKAACLSGRLLFFYLDEFYFVLHELHIR